jgi:hypothetical protein
MTIWSLWSEIQRPQRYTGMDNPYVPFFFWTDENNEMIIMLI